MRFFRSLLLDYAHLHALLDYAYLHARTRAKARSAWHGACLGGARPRRDIDKLDLDHLTQQAVSLHGRAETFTVMLPLHYGKMKAGECDLQLQVCDASAADMIVGQCTVPGASLLGTVTQRCCSLKHGMLYPGILRPLFILRLCLDWLLTSATTCCSFVNNSDTRWISKARSPCAFELVDTHGDVLIGIDGSSSPSPLISVYALWDMRGLTVRTDSNVRGYTHALMRRRSVCLECLLAIAAFSRPSAGRSGCRRRQHGLGRGNRATTAAHPLFVPQHLSLDHSYGARAP